MSLIKLECDSDLHNNGGFNVELAFLISGICYENQEKQVCKCIPGKQWDATGTTKDGILSHCEIVWLQPQGSVVTVTSTIKYKIVGSTTRISLTYRRNTNFGLSDTEEIRQTISLEVKVNLQPNKTTTVPPPYIVITTTTRQDLNMKQTTA
ncbi:hypothetical protein RUM43_006033 [Polyplax serrata]|uniref:Uncharacterized protein n=1 Tax=Polyplax serrata TaxID=468196 RepID=A0AAN8S8X4_POLSC